MKTAYFGKLRIGEIPRVAGTVTTPALLSTFASAIQQGCDVAEVRLDLIGHETDAWIDGCRQIEQTGVPVLLTLRTTAEGGKSALAGVERAGVIRKSLPYVSAIDLEHRITADRPLVDEVHRHGKAVVASFHNFSQTPPLDALQKIVSEAAGYADVVKISTFVRSADDISILRTLLQLPRPCPLCAIGMGPLGTETRTEFPAEGSCLTYGYLDDPSAPGQLPASVLVQHLRKALPKYDAAVSGRR